MDIRESSNEENLQMVDSGPVNCTAASAGEMHPVVEISEDAALKAAEEGKDEDSDSPSEGGEGKRSLEALFQAAHSELENISKRKTVLLTQPKMEGDAVSLLDRGSLVGIPVMIQTADGEHVQGNLVKFVDENGQVQLKVDAASAAKNSPHVIATGASVLAMQPALQPIVTKAPPTGGRKRKHPAKPGKHICPYCGKGCAKPSVLEKHVRAHTGDRPYPCIPCGFSFKTKSNLYKHCKSRSHAFKVSMRKHLVEGELPSDAPPPPGAEGKEDASEAMEEEEDEEEMGEALNQTEVVSAGGKTTSLAVLSSSGSSQHDIKSSILDVTAAGSPAPSGSQLMLSEVHGASVVGTADQLSSFKAELPVQQEKNMNLKQTVNLKQMTPEMLQDRISWLISNNAAIVDTPMADAPRPKRMSRQSSEAEPSIASNVAVYSEDIIASSTLAKQNTEVVNLPQSTANPQVYFLGLAPPSDQPPGESPTLGQEEEVPESSGADSERAGLPPAIKIKFKLPKDDALPTKMADAEEKGSVSVRELFTQSGSAIKDLLSQKNPTQHGPVVINSSVIEHSGAEATVEGNGKASELIIVVHEDGTEESILINSTEDLDLLDEKKAVSLPCNSGDNPLIIDVVDPEQRPQRGRPKGSRNKPKLKLQIPQAPPIVRIQVPPSSADLTNDAVAATPEEAESGTPSAVPNWKLKLKGKLLLKRSISMDRMLSQDGTKEGSPPKPEAPPEGGAFLEKNVRERLLLKRAHSLDLENVCPRKKLVLESRDAKVEPTKADNKCSAESLGASVVTKSGDQRPPPAQAIYMPWGPCPKEDLTHVPSVLTIPLNLAENVPGLVAQATPSDGEEPKEADSAPEGKESSESPFIEHKAVQLTANTPELRQKVIVALLLLGHSYPELKRLCQTVFCSLLKPQPMYVAQGSNRKISMYSNWRAALYNPNIMRLSTREVLSLYQTPLLAADPKYTYSISQDKKSKASILTHSSYWTAKESKEEGANAVSLDLMKIPDLMLPKSPPTETQTPVPEGKETPAGEEAQSSRRKLRQILEVKATQPNPQRVRIFPGGYKSLEDYTYVRGRGRGKYVCEECGIRCKKPSMLKKHFRTHTQLRPFKCSFCEFNFKTKGNLTKHMKSKAHHKRCAELGMKPITLDAENVQNLMQQGKIVDSNFMIISHEEETGQFSDAAEEDLNEDDEEDEEDEEVEEEGEPFEMEPTVAGNDDPKIKTSESIRSGDARSAYIRIGASGEAILEMGDSQDSSQDEPVSGDSPRASIDKEIAASLLDLSKGAESQDADKADGRLSSLIGALKSRTTESVSSSSQKSVPSDTLKDSILPDLEPPTSSVPVTRAGFVPPIFTVSLSDSSSSRKPSSTASSTPSSSKLHPVTVEYVTIMTSSKPIRIPVKVVKPDGDGPPPPAEMVPLPGKVPELGDGPLRCEQCGKTFTKQHEFSLHRTVHAFECTHRCSPCGLSFRTPEALDRHLRSESHATRTHLGRRFGAGGADPRPYKCSDCAVAFRSHGHLARHLRSRMHVLHLESVGKVPAGTAAQLEEGSGLKDLDTLDCEANLKSIQQIWDASSNAEPASPTMEAGQSGEDGGGAKEVEGAHKCGICTKSFTLLHQLKNHLLSHAELRPFVCEYCDAGFTTAQSLKVHLRSHVRERPYVCGVCGDTFARSDHLKQHLRLLHPRSSPAPPSAPSPAPQEMVIEDGIIGHSQDVIVDADEDQVQYIQMPADEVAVVTPAASAQVPHVVYVRRGNELVMTQVAYQEGTVVVDSPVEEVLYQEQPLTSGHFQVVNPTYLLAQEGITFVSDASREGVEVLGQNSRP